MIAHSNSTQNSPPELDLEEIKCPICSKTFNERERLPILLPSCGHSYCLSCLRDQQKNTNSGEDGLTPDTHLDVIKEHNYTFVCPEDK